MTKKGEKRKIFMYPIKSPFKSKTEHKIKKIDSSVNLNVSDSTITSLGISLFKDNRILNFLFNNPDKKVNVDDFDSNQFKKVILRTFLMIFLVPFIFLFLSAIGSNTLFLEGNGVGFLEDFSFFTQMILILLVLIFSYYYFEKFRRFFLRIQNIIDLDSYGVNNYKEYIDRKTNFINGISKKETSNKEKGNFLFYKIIIYILGCIGIFWWVFPYKKIVYASLNLPFTYPENVWRNFTYSSLTGMVYIIYYFIIIVFIILPLIWRLLASSIVLNRFCKDFNKYIELITLHPDGVGGLSPIADVALNFHFILLLPILTFIANIYFWGVTQSTLVGSFYFVILIFVFFLPLTSAHNVMLNFKKDELTYLSKRHNDFVKEYKKIIKNKNLIDEDIKIMEKMDKIRSYYGQINSMPIWPFDITILSRFAGSILIPLFFLLLQVYVFS